MDLDYEHHLGLRSCKAADAAWGSNHIVAAIFVDKLATAPLKLAT